MSNSNRQYILKLWLTGIEEPLFINVDNAEAERFILNLENAEFDSELKRFCNISSLDGKLYSINLKHLQGIHFLWEVVSPPQEDDRYDGELQIVVSNRAKTISTCAGAVETFDLFILLESYPDELAFRGFLDVDGEQLFLQIDEIVYAFCSDKLYEEGREIAEEEYD